MSFLGFERSRLSLARLSWIDWACLLTVVLLLFCGIERHLRDPSFWLDEAYVAQSLQKRTPWMVFGPLENAQAFPRIYLFCISLMVKVFGYKTLVARFLSFLFYGLSSAAIVILLRRVFRNSWIPLLWVLGLLISEPHWIRQCSNLKQYSWEMFWALFPFLFSNETWTEVFERGKKRGLILLWCVPLLLSYSYPIAISARALTWFVARRKKVERFLPKPGTLVWASVAALVCFGIFYLIDFRFFPKSAMNSYWGGKILRNQFSHPAQALALISSFFFDWYKEALPQTAQILMGITFVVGLWVVLKNLWMGREQRSLAISAVFVLLGSIAASVVAGYPLENGRITLFCWPFWVLLSGLGVEALTKRVHKQFMVLIVLAFLMITVRFWNGMRREHVWQNLRPLYSLFDSKRSETVFAFSSACKQVLTLPEGFPRQRIRCLEGEADLTGEDLSELKNASPTYLVAMTGTAAYPEAAISSLRSQGFTISELGSGPSVYVFWLQ